MVTGSILISFRARAKRPNQWSSGTRARLIRLLQHAGRGHCFATKPAPSSSRGDTSRHAPKTPDCDSFRANARIHARRRIRALRGGAIIKRQENASRPSEVHDPHRERVSLTVTRRASTPSVSQYSNHCESDKSDFGGFLQIALNTFSSRFCISRNAEDQCGVRPLDLRCSPGPFQVVISQGSPRSIN